MHPVTNGSMKTGLSKSGRRWRPRDSVLQEKPKNAQPIISVANDGRRASNPAFEGVVNGDGIWKSKWFADLFFQKSLRLQVDLIRIFKPFLSGRRRLKKTGTLLPCKISSSKPLSI
jgi:hypothetical protein